MDKSWKKIVQMKVVYVLVSTNEDYYLEQTILGAYSAKKYNPELAIEVVVDQDTEKTLTGNRARLKEYVSNVIVIEVPEKYNMMQRSRFLKTNLAEYIDGDFIYMDSDTVISGSLDGIYGGVQSIGMIRDENLEEYSMPIKNWIKGNCEKVGWQDLSQEKGYNGGVIIVKRNGDSKRFFESWHDNWLECCSKGYDRDQLALTKSNIECNHIANEVDGKYNCQVAKFESDIFKKDARVIHYYDMGTVFYIYHDYKLWNKFKNNVTIPQKFLDAVENPQKVFLNRYVKAYEEDIQFLRSNWHDIYNESITLQKYLLRLNCAICGAWKYIRVIKKLLQ